MFYANYTSMLVHYEQCQHVKGSLKKKMVTFLYLQEARNRGYRVCKCCAPLVKKAHLQSKRTKDFCRQHSMRIDVADGDLSVRTPYSMWLIKWDKRKILLFHRNETGHTKNYHQQAFYGRQVMAYLEYIAKHDQYRQAKPLPEEPPQEKGQLPPKGTKRYARAIKELRKKQKEYEIKRVLSLIDRLELERTLLDIVPSDKIPRIR